MNDRNENQLKKRGEKKDKPIPSLLFETNKRS